MATAALEHSSVHEQVRSVTRRSILLSSAFIVLLALALWVRLLTFERYLPFLDYTDESVYQVASLNWRGEQSNEFITWRYAQLPPLYVGVTTVMQELVDRLVGRPWTLPAEYMYAQRLLAVLVGVVTTAVICSIGWQLGGSVAAWVSGLIWAFTPIIVDHNSLALPDPFVYLTIAIAISAALRAWHTEALKWLFVSLVAGVLAIYFKYWPIHILIPWGIVALILLKRRPRRFLPFVIAQGVLGALSAAFLLQNYGALEIPAREVLTFRDSGLTLALNLDRNLTNWWFSIYPIGSAIFWGVLALGLVAYLWSRRHQGKTVQLSRWTVLFIYCVFGVMMASSFTTVWLAAGKIRHVLPMTIALIGIFSAAVAQVTWTLQHRFSHNPLLTFAPVVGLTLFIGISSALNLSPIVAEYQRVDMRQVLWQWTNDNLTPDGLILIHPGGYLERVWNRDWSGYDGYTSFEWWHETDTPQGTISEYVERGIAYFTYSEADLRTVYRGNRNFQDFINSLTLVKTFPAAPTIAGPTVYFYRMLPPQFEADATFGEQIALVGYDLDKTALAPGESLVFRPYWRTVQPPQTNYSMFIHIYPRAREELVTQYDGAPTSTQRLTLTWTDPDELYIGSDVVLTLPQEIVTGDYRLVVGLYDFASGARLLLPNGESYYTIDLQVE